MQSDVQLVTGAAADVDAVYAAIRGAGPSFWADRGRRWTVIGRLTNVGMVSAENWRVVGRRRVNGRAATVGASTLPFAGGVVGWFGYEAGAWMERMPAPVGARVLPDAWLGECGSFACFDQLSRVWFATPDLRGVVRAARSEPAPPVGKPVLLDAGDRRAFEQGVTTILEHLRRGDVYQVNLARQVVVDAPGDPWTVWRRLRASNPARRAMLIETDDGAVVSNSPELLLCVQGGRLLSVPIKGTAAKSSDAVALLSSEKERAELTMIVDLVRSDLSRVARVGSVKTAPRRVGGVGHVWHAMRRVTAELRPGLDAVDAFAALFPAGSVTGAPKVRAMEVIRALEAAPRGVYCGAIGWFGDDGDGWWNVGIRTIQFAGEQALFHVGAGIVLGSDPASEYAETTLKARRMAEAFG